MLHQLISVRLTCSNQRTELRCGSKNIDIDFFSSLSSPSWAEKPLSTRGCVTRVLSVPLVGSVAEVIICVVLSGLVSGKNKGESSGQELELVGIAAAYVVGENLDLWAHLAAGEAWSALSLLVTCYLRRREGGILEENQQLSHWLHISSAPRLSLLGLIAQWLCSQLMKQFQSVFDCLFSLKLYSPLSFTRSNSSGSRLPLNLRPRVSASLLLGV